MALVQRKPVHLIIVCNCTHFVGTQFVMLVSDAALIIRANTTLHSHTQQMPLHSVAAVVKLVRGPAEMTSHANLFPCSFAFAVMLVSLAFTLTMLKCNIRNVYIHSVSHGPLY